MGWKVRPPLFLRKDSGKHIESHLHTFQLLAGMVVADPIMEDNTEKKLKAKFDKYNKLQALISLDYRCLNVVLNTFYLK